MSSSASSNPKTIGDANLTLSSVPEFLTLDSFFLNKYITIFK
jgi:hypothetical protein